MIIPVRCFTCNKVIAHLWEEYQQKIQEQYLKDDVANNQKARFIDINDIKNKTVEGKILDNMNNQIVIFDVENQEHHPITSERVNSPYACWSPSGDWLIFLSDRNFENYQNVGNRCVVVSIDEILRNEGVLNIARYIQPMIGSENVLYSDAMETFTTSVDTIRIKKRILNDELKNGGFFTNYVIMAMFLIFDKDRKSVV